MATKKNDPRTGTEQETADDSELGKTPTSQPQEDGPNKPADSPYAD